MEILNYKADNLMINTHRIKLKAGETQEKVIISFSFRNPLILSTEEGFIENNIDAISVMLELKKEDLIEFFKPILTRLEK